MKDFIGNELEFGDVVFSLDHCKEYPIIYELKSQLKTGGYELIPITKIEPEYCQPRRKVTKLNRIIKVFNQNER